jgi:septum formation protein
MNNCRKLILASKSPRRSDLLKQNDVEFEVIVRDTQELSTYPVIEELPVINALRKAEKVAEEYPDAVVIGADTIVVYDNSVIGKPRDYADAVNILHKLVGNTHTVITGVAILCKEAGKSETFNVKSFVTFKNLSHEEICRYIEKVYVLDKAGAYAMQENHDLIVELFEGSFDNIVGLPVKEVLECLEKF